MTGFIVCSLCKSFSLLSSTMLQCSTQPLYPLNEVNLGEEFYSSPPNTWQWLPLNSKALMVHRTPVLAINSSANIVFFLNFAVFPRSLNSKCFQMETVLSLVCTCSFPSSVTDEALIISHLDHHYNILLCSVIFFKSASMNLMQWSSKGFIFSFPRHFQHRISSLRLTPNVSDFLPFLLTLSNPGRASVLLSKIPDPLLHVSTELTSRGAFPHCLRANISTVLCEI